MEKSKKIEDLRLRFIEEHKGIEAILNSIFGKAESFEKKFDKDLSMFNEEEALDYLKSYRAMSLNVLQSRITHIKKYCLECRAQGIKGTDEGAWDKLTVSMVNSCVDVNKALDKYFPPEQMEQIITSLINPVDRFVIRGFYEGLRGDAYEDIWDLYPEDVDRETRTIDLSHARLAGLGLSRNKKIQVSQKLIDDMYASLNAEEYIYIREDWNSPRSVKLNESKGRFFKVAMTKISLQDYENLVVEKQRVTTKVKKLRELLKIKELSVPAIVGSAVIAKVKEIAREENISDAEAFESKAFVPVQARYGLFNRSFPQLRERYRLYLDK